jgi:hypothetical protein
MKAVRRALVCLVGIGAAAAPVPALARTAAPRLNRLPKVTEQAARHYSIVALRRRFKADFSLGGFNSTCRRRISRTRVRCSVSWFQGDAVFNGHTEIWYSRHGQEVEWNYLYTITDVDTYCSQVQHRPLSRCSRHYHVS